jgi:hypothetical protein
VCERKTATDSGPGGVRGWESLGTADEREEFVVYLGKVVLQLRDE